jgi:hypothetical protein
MMNKYTNPESELPISLVMKLAAVIDEICSEKCNEKVIRQSASHVVVIQGIAVS